MLLEADTEVVGGGMTRLCGQSLQRCSGAEPLVGGGSWGETRKPEHFRVPESKLFAILCMNVSSVRKSQSAAKLTDAVWQGTPVIIPLYPPLRVDHLRNERKVTYCKVRTAAFSCYT